MASTDSRSVLRAAERPTTVRPSITGTPASVSGSGEYPTPDTSSGSGCNGGAEGVAVRVATGDGELPGRSVAGP